ncbi:PilN domain-containing protein [Patescibacteria group bacterium]|nr:PilN domain-containing protein [Patescibacteria group bacterium]
MPYYINLKPSFSDKNAKNYIFAWFVNHGKYYLLFFNVVLFALYLTRIYLTGVNYLKRKSIEEKLGSIEKMISPVNKYNNLQKMAKSIENVKSNNFVASNILKSFQQNTPEGVYIQSLSFAGNNLSLTATSKNSSEFSVFLNFLIKDSTFEKVILTSSDFDNLTGYYKNKFEILKKLNGTN